MARKYRRKSAGLGFGGVSVKKLGLALLAGMGAMAVIGAVKPDLDSRISGGLGGFFAGGPLGAVVGAFGPGLLMGTVAGATSTASSGGGGKLF